MQVADGQAGFGIWLERVLQARRKVDVVWFPSMLKTVWYRMFTRDVYVHHRARIKGASRITVNGRLLVGVAYRGFLHHSDVTYINVRGHVAVTGHVNIGRGCRFDIGPNGVCELNNCSVTGLSTFIIAHHLRIGTGTVISWGCEFLDEDWHTLEYEGRRSKSADITIGEHVWIGSHVRVLKGVSIGDGAVIGCGSVVTSSVPPHCLVAGNPARVIRTDVEWS